MPNLAAAAREYLDKRFPDQTVSEKRKAEDLRVARSNHIIAEATKAAMSAPQDYEALAKAMLKPYQGKIDGVSASAKEAVGVMDAAGSSFSAGFQNYAIGMLSAGMQLSQNGGGGFLGYPYLASLLLRSEYQRVCQKWAEQCVRKGITLSRSDDKDDDKEGRIKFVEKELARLDWKKAAHEVIFGDRAFGGYHTLLVVTKKGSDDENLDLLKGGVPSGLKGGKGWIKCLRNIEPLWVYPDAGSNFNNPAADGFYEPETWQVNGLPFHKSVLLTVVGLPVPDVFKPAFFYRGIAITQLIAPYVDRFLNNAAAASELLKSFSMVVLKTNMAEAFSDVGYQKFKERADAFTQFRDNRNFYVLNKDTEELEILASPLTGIPEFVSQSLEQVATAANLTVMAFTSQQPTGLNASGEGETRTMYESIDSYREYVLKGWLSSVIKTIEELEYGDSVLDFEFENLHEPDRKEEMEIQEIKTRINDSNIASGIISEKEARDQIKSDDDSIYANISLGDELPVRPDVNPELDRSILDDNDDAGLGVTRSERDYNE